MIHAANIYDVSLMHINHRDDLKCSRETRAKKEMEFALPSPNPITLHSVVNVEQDTEKSAEGGGVGGKDSGDGRVPLEWLVSLYNGNGKWGSQLYCFVFHSDLKRFPLGVAWQSTGFSE